MIHSPIDVDNGLLLSGYLTTNHDPIIIEAFLVNNRFVRQYIDTDPIGVEYNRICVREGLLVRDQIMYNSSGDARGHAWLTFPPNQLRLSLDYKLTSRLIRSTNNECPDPSLANQHLLADLRTVFSRFYDNEEVWHLGKIFDRSKGVLSLPVNAP